MSAARKLTLKRETLTELTRDELRGVAGAAAVSGASCPICPPTLEQSCLGTCHCTPATPLG